ncbi:MAG: hypothetical protein O2788_03780, partial [Chloroflexi bacterium]|nr:hypothetical protein [Chloroflexota bacterium]
AGNHPSQLSSGFQQQFGITQRLISHLSVVPLGQTRLLARSQLHQSGAQPPPKNQAVSVIHLSGIFRDYQPCWMPACMKWP